MLLKLERPLQLPLGNTSNESANCHPMETVWSIAEVAGGGLGRDRGVPVNGCGTLVVHATSAQAKHAMTDNRIHMEEHPQKQDNRAKALHA